MRKMTADDLAKKYNLQPHEENGAYFERHYIAPKNIRAASGAIYYYLAAKEKAQFHQIDCDEYWAYVLGSPLELWLIDGTKKISRQILGIEKNAEPLIYVPQGTIFGARHLDGAEDGTFLSCITVPRFDYKGWKLFSKEEMLKTSADVAKFYE